MTNATHPFEALMDITARALSAVHGQWWARFALPILRSNVIP
jgi:hypothetical protein